MRLHLLATAGFAALLGTSTALAGECITDADDNDCDGDGILDYGDGVDPDRCPFTATPGGANAENTTLMYTDTTTPIPGLGADCIGTNVSVDPEATIGFGVELGNNASIFSRAYVGDYATIGGTSDPAVVGVRARLADAPSPALGTEFVSGIIGRSATTGEDPGSTPRLDREGDVQTGADLTMGRSAIIGFGARLGENVSLGYASVIGPQAVIGSNVVVGNLSEIGWGATIGNGFVLARSSSIGNFAVIGNNVIVGPEVSIGTYAQVGGSAEGDATVRIRKGVTIGKWSVINAGTRIGRNSDIGDYSEVNADVTLRANTTVLEGGVACSDAASGDLGDCAVNGYYPRGAIIDGISANVPAEPSGTFFSAAGGIVCTNPSANGCIRKQTVVDGVTRYCLDNDNNGVCDGGTPGVPAQAIVITAPDTIGVSPYCYNDTDGVTQCVTLQSPSGCGGDGNPPCYQLQAGPIYVLSPPDDN